jgi:hypothetical protein
MANEKRGGQNRSGRDCSPARGKMTRSSNQSSRSRTSSKTSFRDYSLRLSSCLRRRQNQIKCVTPPRTTSSVNRCKLDPVLVLFSRVQSRMTCVVVLWGWPTAGAETERARAMVVHDPYGRRRARSGVPRVGEDVGTALRRRLLRRLRWPWWWTMAALAGDGRGRGRFDGL